MNSLMKKFDKWQINNAKAVVKYLDPKNILMKSIDYSLLIQNLDRKWIEQNNPKWLERYDEVNSLKFRLSFYYGQKLYIGKRLKKIIRKLIKKL